MTRSDKPAPAAILKRDSRSRVRSSLVQRLEVVEQYDRSGLSGPAFCQVAGINYQTFVGWRKEARRQAAAQAGDSELQPAVEPSRAIALVEAVLQAAPPARSQEGLQVHLPGGARLVITDAAQMPLAVQLIQALA